MQFVHDYNEIHHLMNPNENHHDHLHNRKNDDFIRYLVYLLQVLLFAFTLLQHQWR